MAELGGGARMPSDLGGRWLRPHLTQRRILVRCDAAGASHRLAETCVERNIEARQRQRARAENVIRDAKATGLVNLAFEDIVNNGTCRLALCDPGRGPRSSSGCVK